MVRRVPPVRASRRTPSDSPDGIAKGREAVSDDMGAILLIVFASLGGLCGLLALMAVLEPAKPAVRVREEPAGGAGGRTPVTHRPG